MKYTSFRFLFAALFACGLFLFLHATSAKAQLSCPDSTGPGPNPDSIPWVQDSSDVPIAGTSCSMEVYFCERTVNDTIQAWMDGVAFDSTTDCDSISDSALIYYGQLGLDTIIAEANENLLEPCFKNQSLIIQIYAPQCWMPVNPPGGIGYAHITLILACSSFNLYCERQCDVCFNAGPPFQLVFSNCEVTTTAFDIICISGVPWDKYVCYNVSCNNWSDGAAPHIKTGFNMIEPQAPASVTAASVLDTSMKAFPNPTSTILTVTSSITGEPIEVLDVLGKEVLTGTIQSNGSLTLDVSVLPAGTYYVSAGRKELSFIKN